MGRTCSAHVLPMFCASSFHDNSMNNLLSYCGLVDARISASEKDLPVTGDMAVPDSLRLEKEKGRELTKMEKMTTMKALVMMKTNSIKKKKIGENGEEVDEFSDEEDGQGGKRKSLKQRMKGMNLI